MSIPSDKVSTIFGKAEGFWLVGYGLLLQEPSLILFTVNLSILGLYALFLWLSYMALTELRFRKQTRRK